MRKELEDKYRDSTTNSMGLIRKLRITCIHRYEDGSGDFVIDIKIEPKVLKTR
jgi:hypothetical protein